MNVFARGLAHEKSQYNTFPRVAPGTCHSCRNIYFAILVGDGLEIAIKKTNFFCLLKPVIFLPLPSFLTMQLEPPKPLFPLWGAARGSLPCPPSHRRRIPPWRARSVGVAGPPPAPGAACLAGGGGGEGRPVDRSLGGPFRPETSLCPPRMGNIVGVTGDALVMGGSAPILFWCAAACRPRAWSGRRSGALVQARPSAATPAGAGGLGRWGARRAGPAAPPPPPASRSLLGEGGHPLGSGGPGRRLSCGSQARGGSGGGGGGAAPPPPRPPRLVRCPPAILCLRRAPPGYTRAVGVAGRLWASGAARSAANGSVRRGRGEGRGGVVSSPWFAPPPSPGRPLKGLLRLRHPGRRRSAVGRYRVGRERAGGSPGALAAAVVPPPPPGRSGLAGRVLGRCLSGLPPSALGPEGGGGGERGGPSGPLAPPPDGRGGAAWWFRPWGVALFPAPLHLSRARPSCRPLLGSPAPPAVIARRWLVGGGCEGQWSAVSGLRGSGFLPALVVSALPPTGGGARPSVAPYCGGGVGRGARLCRGGGVLWHCPPPFLLRPSSGPSPAPPLVWGLGLWRWRVSPAVAPVGEGVAQGWGEPVVGVRIGDAERPPPPPPQEGRPRRLSVGPRRPDH